MSDDRTGKRRPLEQHEQEGAVQARAQREEREPKRDHKASPVERREWRGSGVCGDRHTD
ncbi:MAG TPA: hypothetical protein VN668_11995 [Stellaceae bacterium]|nr:hypothetical protein [Stellaceae bacterium]